MPIERERRATLRFAAGLALAALIGWGRGGPFAYVLPLLALLLLAPGLLLGNARAHAWACFVVNIYFIQGVLAAIDPARALFGALETVISLGLFCSALLYVRWKFQHDRKLAGE